ncbi:hypothetical protein CROQUDRAFT_100227 [Cronartium quercuum f. sp. fusiforme G11]|uniref:Uncharacterized protein n=1 Tax=Cronartium quercuum f. sp. fusiforme G11 TaxID=708437 RepID=A0A9P6T7E1_9BASI|nr:hypothetical protein CROQUDRAFT_100227 [Cronartium quercuum f. sp. fusiforme G11]
MFEHPIVSVSSYHSCLAPNQPLNEPSSPSDFPLSSTPVAHSKTCEESLTPEQPAVFASLEFDTARSQFLLRLFQVPRLHQMATTAVDGKKACAFLGLALIEPRPEYYRTTLLILKGVKQQSQNACFAQAKWGRYDSFVKLRSKNFFNSSKTIQCTTKTQNCKQVAVWWQLLVALDSFGTSENGGDHFHHLVTFRTGPISTPRERFQVRFTSEKYCGEDLRWVDVHKNQALPAQPSLTQPLQRQMRAPLA